MSRTIPCLRWVLGLVVLIESIRFAITKSHPFHLPHWLPVSLGTAEALGAILFLIPVTSRAGAYALLIVFGLAAAIHILHGEPDVGGLAVYAAAVVVCMSAEPARA